MLQSCVSCLGSVVNNVTHNYKLVRDCFQKFFGKVYFNLPFFQMFIITVNNVKTLLSSCLIFYELSDLYFALIINFVVASLIFFL